MENPVLIIGANLFGRIAKEIFESQGNLVYGFMDDNAGLHGKEIDLATVLGRTDDEELLKLIGPTCEVFVATDDNKLRKTLIEHVVERRKTQPVNAIHSQSIINSDTHMGHGNLLDMGVLFGYGAKLGSYNLVMAGAVIGAFSEIGSYTQIGSGTIINTEVVIEDGAFIGSGVTIVTGVRIGKNARIGAGSVVIASVENNKTVFGNPAVEMKS